MNFLDLPFLSCNFRWHIETEGTCWYCDLKWPFAFSLCIMVFVGRNIVINFEDGSTIRSSLTMFSCLSFVKPGDLWPQNAIAGYSFHGDLYFVPNPNMSNCPLLRSRITSEHGINGWMNGHGRAAQPVMHELL